MVVVEVVVVAIVVVVVVVVVVWLWSLPSVGPDTPVFQRKDDDLWKFYGTAAPRLKVLFRTGAYGASYADAALRRRRPRLAPCRPQPRPHPDEPAGLCILRAFVTVVLCCLRVTEPAKCRTPPMARANITSRRQRTCDRCRSTAWWTTRWPCPSGAQQAPCLRVLPRVGQC